jgi:hypothetical protein
MRHRTGKRHFVVSGSLRRAPLLSALSSACGKPEIGAYRLGARIRAQNVPDYEMFVYSATKIIAGVPGQWRTYRDFGADRIERLLRAGIGQLLAYLNSGMLIWSLSVYVIEPVDGRFNQGNRGRCKNPLRINSRRIPR